jgi:hypothetical protein
VCAHGAAFFSAAGCTARYRSRSFAQIRFRFLRAARYDARVTSPPRGTPGPRDPDGGDFVLLEPTPLPEVEADAEAAPAELADGSDVYDVEALEAELKAEQVDALLREYLDDVD